MGYILFPSDAKVDLLATIDLLIVRKVDLSIAAVDLILVLVKLRF